MQIDNPRGVLLPGAYARVRLKMGPQSGLPRIPVTALLFRPDGLWAAVVVEERKVQLRRVSPGRDFGTEIEIREGLSIEDWVIANPPESLIDGAEVRLQSAKGH
jgi:hypothetical protein